MIKAFQINTMTYKSNMNSNYKYSTRKGSKTQKKAPRDRDNEWETQVRMKKEK